MSELLSCPFCGVENTDVGYINHTRECYLKRSWFGDKKQFLIESWNTRPLEDALRAQLVAAEERERVLREALVDMCVQYLTHSAYGVEPIVMTHNFMSAGEHALDLLEELGLVEPSEGEMYTLKPGVWP